QGFKGQHNWTNYLGGGLIIFFFFFMAQSLVGAFIQFKAMNAKNPISLAEGTFTEVINASGLPSNLVIFFMLLSFVVGFGGIYIVIKYSHNRNLKSLIYTRKKMDWKRFFFSFGLMAVLIIISTVFAYYNNPEDFEIQFQLLPFLILLLISLLLIPIQVAFEEILFRGYLLQGFGVIFKNNWVPWILTSVFFGLMHGSNPEVAELGKTLLIYYIGTGLFLGILTLMDDGIELALGFHTANNLIQILLITSDYSIFQSASILKEITKPDNAWQEIVFPLLVIYPLFILIFSKVYQWKNWKEKLFGKIKTPLKTIENHHEL